MRPGSRAWHEGPDSPKPETPETQAGVRPTRREELTTDAVAKRTGMTRALMECPETRKYLEMCAITGETPPVLPDPADASFSKRQWEKAFASFKYRLRGLGAFHDGEALSWFVE